MSTFVGDETTHTTIGTSLHSGKLTDHCDNCRNTECNARIIVDLEEHKQHCGFCSQECFNSALHSLLVKDVDWDVLKTQSSKHKAHSYKELRSLIKAGKMTHDEAQKIISEHLTKKLGSTIFPHAHSQKEGVIEMD